MMESDRKKSSRLPLLGLLTLFGAPLVAAFWLYYGTGWRPTSTTNHGTLIDPARSLSALPYPQAQTRPAVEKLLTGKWSMLVIATGRCDDTCRSALVYTRQTHLGLGRLGARVQRVLLVPTDCCDREYLDREHAGLLIADLGGDAALSAGRDALLAAFPGERQGQQIFIVDPLGNLMMRYDTQDDPKGLRDDMKKLLGLSHIG